jgi:hypothetical protein
MPKLCKDKGKLRQCSKCKKWKLRDTKHFIKIKTCNYGIGGICKECSNKNSTRWKRANRVRLAKRRSELYYSSEKIIEANREAERWRNDPVKKRAQALRNAILDRVRKNGYKFDDKYFTVKRIIQMLISNPFCDCCGTKFKISKEERTNKNYADNESPSFDRIDPEKGYTKNNTALICWRCNNLKRDAIPIELEIIAEWMRERGPKKWKK